MAPPLRAGLYGRGRCLRCRRTALRPCCTTSAPPTATTGRTPFGNLIFDSAGNLYGTTFAGGTYGKGTVFELSPYGTETVLYNFGSGADGQNPYAGLIFDSSGNLYGTTVNGGAYGGGTAFELSPNGAGGWTETGLYSFGNGPLTG